MFDLPTLIKSAGYLGLFGIVFAESGVLIGVVFPGDSLLFTSGLLASQGYFNIWLLSVITFVGAVLGDNVGYAFGKKVGPKIFTREDSWFFHKKHLEHTKHFYEKHGPKALILARFMPIVRTFTPILAGVGQMNYKSFFKYNVVGGALWSFGITFAGYFLGNTVPDVDKYLLPIVGVIILASVIPIVVHILKERLLKKA